MAHYRLDREANVQENGSIPVVTDWMGGPILAAVRNCPIAGTDLRRSARITGEPDSAFSQPAYVTVGGLRVNGYITGDEQGYEFRAYDDNKHKLNSLSPIL